MEDRCRARTKEIVRAHQPEPVSEELGRAMDEICEAAMREWGS